MSVYAVQAVWDCSKADSPTDRLVLLAIADSCGHDFEVSISIYQIERMTLLSERTVQRSIARLVEIGDLNVLDEGGGNGRGCGRPKRLKLACSISPTKLWKRPPADAVKGDTVTDSATHESLNGVIKGDINGVTVTNSAAVDLSRMRAPNTQASYVGLSTTGPEVSIQASNVLPVNSSVVAVNAGEDADRPGLSAQARTHESARMSQPAPIPPRPTPYRQKFGEAWTYEMEGKPLPEGYAEDIAAYAAYKDADEKWLATWGKIEQSRKEIEDRKTINETDPAATKPARKETKVSRVIDLCRTRKVEPVIDGRDGKAINDCTATADLIAEAYCAVMLGDWGDAWLRNNLSFRIICGRVSGYVATVKGKAKTITPGDPRYYQAGWSEGALTKSEERRVRHV